MLWLWRRTAAIALIRTLAWQPPYAMGVALEETKKRPKKKNLTRIHDDVGSVPGLTLRVKDMALL